MYFHCTPGVPSLFLHFLKTNKVFLTHSFARELQGCTNKTNSSRLFWIKCPHWQHASASRAPLGWSNGRFAFIYTSFCRCTAPRMSCCWLQTAFGLLYLFMLWDENANPVQPVFHNRLTLTLHSPRVLSQKLTVRPFTKHYREAGIQATFSYGNQAIKYYQMYIQ